MKSITAIIGPSAAGKSAIIRAMKWCLFNEAPSNFQRTGAEGDETLCRVTFDNGDYVERSRKGRENKYIVKPEGQDEVVYTGFGAGVFDVVTDFTGIKAVPLFGDEVKINFHEQHSPIFFLSKSPMQKAAAIGTFGKVELIDEAASNILSGIRGSNSELKNLAERKTYISNELTKEKYLRITAFENEFDTVKKISSDISARNLAVTGVERSSAAIKRNVEALGKFNELSLKYSSLPQIKATVEEVDNFVLLEKRTTKLEELMGATSKSIADAIIFSNMEGELYDASEAIKKLTSLKITERRIQSTLDDIDFLQQSLLKKDRVIGRKDTTEAAEDLVRTISERNATQKQFRDKIHWKVSFLHDSLIQEKKAQANYNDIKAEYEAFIKENPICPLCENPIRS